MNTYTHQHSGDRPPRAFTCRLRVDSSSLMPPERKWMPGTAGGMLRSIVRTVCFATSCGGGVGTSRPAGRTTPLQLCNSSVLCVWKY